MPALETLHDLFVHELRDIFDAENQQLQSLPLMMKATQNEQLVNSFELHLKETKEQIRRLEQIFQGLGVSPEGKTCRGMRGLIEEARELMQQEADPAVMEAGLIVAAQKLEHYEICGYGTVRTFARVLGYKDAAQLLERSLKEESMTDEKLTTLAKKLNPLAESADLAPEAKTKS